MKNLIGKPVTITSCHHVANPGDKSRFIGKTGVVIEKCENKHRQCNEYLIEFDDDDLRAYYTEDQFTVNETRPDIIDTLRAFYDGEPLDDTELVKLHLHVAQTAKMLFQLGDRFHLAMVECLRVADITNGYITTRGIKNK